MEIDNLQEMPKPIFREKNQKKKKKNKKNIIIVSSGDFLQYAER